MKNTHAKSAIWLNAEKYPEITGTFSRTGCAYVVSPALARFTTDPFFRSKDQA